MLETLSCRGRTRKDLDKARISRDENSVVGVFETLRSMINPFESDSPEELVNIVSGAVIDEDTKQDIDRAYTVGNEKFLQFVNMKVICENPCIFDKMTLLKLKTFKAKKMSAKTSKGETVQIKSEYKFWVRLLLIAKHRNIDTKDVLKYCLHPYPAQFATTCGSLKKTVKAKLMNQIENETSDCMLDSVEASNAIIIDAMSILQTLKPVPTTFGELSVAVLHRIIAVANQHQSARIDFVVDRYPDVSTKNVERNQRGKGGVQLITIYNKGQKVPIQWKKFMSCGKNKEALVEFLFDQWKSVADDKLGELELYVTHGNKCHLIRYSAATLHVVCEEVYELFCDHEEADTRMLLHASHAAQTRTNIVINSVDTDVFLLCIYCASKIPATLAFDTGMGKKRRIIDMNKISEQLDEAWCDAILGFHWFTGL